MKRAMRTLLSMVLVISMLAVSVFAAAPVQHGQSIVDKPDLEEILVERVQEKLEDLLADYLDQLPLDPETKEMIHDLLSEMLENLDPKDLPTEEELREAAEELATILANQVINELAEELFDRLGIEDPGFIYIPNLPTIEVPGIGEVPYDEELASQVINAIAEQIFEELDIEDPGFIFFPMPQWPDCDDCLPHHPVIIPQNLEELFELLETIYRNHDLGFLPPLIPSDRSDHPDHPILPDISDLPHFPGLPDFPGFPFPPKKSVNPQEPPVISPDDDAQDVVPSPVLPNLDRLAEFLASFGVIGD